MKVEIVSKKVVTQKNLVVEYKLPCGHVNRMTFGERTKLTEQDVRSLGDGRRGCLKCRRGEYL